ncbi:transposase [Pseudanabaena sp. FACHB-2040]|uniref:transposase n=1 Tax=Pseudanabaena sp. FACHB-2040 TaxID=2692859 RepID=UPI0016867B27|nr:transposase [Pseudanabaena sp. FACHB-2040]MBD2256694.1 transposase [Pseudanabaena sp. FACHB-2040]
MPRRQVDFVPGHHYHLYNRGNNRQNIFFERENYLYFLQQFRRYLVEDTLDVLAYCLMPNHYHFLVRLRSQTLSQQMQAFSLSYTKAINRRYGRCGSLFQGRFRSIHVNCDRYLLYLSRYIHLNPVAAGFVEAPEAWEFSSYREYVELRQGTLPKLNPIRQDVGTAEDYQAFVLANAVRLPKLSHLMLDE